MSKTRLLVATAAMAYLCAILLGFTVGTSCTPQAQSAVIRVAESTCTEVIDAGGMPFPVDDIVFLTCNVIDSLGNDAGTTQVSMVREHWNHIKHGAWCYACDGGPIGPPSATMHAVFEARINWECPNDAGRDGP